VMKAYDSRSPSFSNDRNTRNTLRSLWAIPYLGRFLRQRKAYPTFPKQI
jgi:hypothetical protein